MLEELESKVKVHDIWNNPLGEDIEVVRRYKDHVMVEREDGSFDTHSINDVMDNCTIMFRRFKDGCYFEFDVDTENGCWYDAKGELHREDGPAVIGESHTAWMIHGKHHREDGPAIVSRHGREWFHNGNRHREDGPAIERSDGEKQYYRNGVKYTDSEYYNIVNVGYYDIKDETKVSDTSKFKLYNETARVSFIEHDNGDLEIIVKKVEDGLVNIKIEGILKT